MAVEFTAEQKLTEINDEIASKPGEPVLIITRNWQSLGCSMRGSIPYGIDENTYLTVPQSPYLRGYERNGMIEIVADRVGRGIDGKSPYEQQTRPYRLSFMQEPHVLPFFFLSSLVTPLGDKPRDATRHIWEIDRPEQEEPMVQVLVGAERFNQWLKPTDRRGRPQEVNATELAYFYRMLQVLGIEHHMDKELTAKAVQKVGEQQSLVFDELLRYVQPFTRPILSGQQHIPNWEVNEKNRQKIEAVYHHGEDLGLDTSDKHPALTLFTGKQVMFPISPAEVMHAISEKLKEKNTHSARS